MWGTITNHLKIELWQRKFMRSIAQTTGIHTIAVYNLLYQVESEDVER